MKVKRRGFVYKSGEQPPPKNAVGVYACRTPILHPGFDGLLEDEFLLWDGADFYHLGGDKYRDWCVRVHWYLGPLPRLKTNENIPPF